MVDTLLQAGADPRLRDHEYQCTPRAFGICVAASWGIVPILNRVLEMDASIVNILEGRGTPLHEAARVGHAKIVEALLCAGADASIRDTKKISPLELAREGKHETVIQLLQPGTES